MQVPRVQHRRAMDISYLGAQAGRRLLLVCSNSQSFLRVVVFCHTKDHSLYASGVSTNFAKSTGACGVYINREWSPILYIFDRLA